MTDIVVGVRLKADGSGFVGQVRLSGRELDKFGDSAEDASRKTKRLNQSSSELGSSFGDLKGAIATLGLGLLARSVVRTASEFEQLRIRLETVTGSAESAARAFDQIKEFARTTPFEVENLVTAFTRLRAAGIQPTTELMESFGNTAAAFGRDITEFADAVVGAITGETERLKAFGIIARIEGERMRLIFRGNTREINRDADSIVAALTDIGAVDFAGGMERQTDSLAGAFSNLQDAVSEFFDTIGEKGATDFLTDQTRFLTGLLEESTKILDPSVVDTLQRTNQEIDGLRRRLADLGDEEPSGFFGTGAFGFFSSRAEIEETLNTRLRQRADLLRRLDVQRRSEDAASIAEAEAEAIAAANRERDRELKQRRELEEAADKVNEKIELEISQLRRLSEARTGGAIAIARANTESEVEIALAKAGIDANSQLGETISRNVRERERLKAVIEEQDDVAERENDLREEGLNLTESLRTAQEELNAEVERYKLLLDEGVINQETYNRAVLDAQESYRQATSESNVLANAIDGALNSALDGNITSWQDLGRVAVSVLTNIVQQIFEAARATNSLSGGGGILGDLFSGFFGSPATAGTATAPAAGGFRFTNAPGLHSGGIAGRDASFRRLIPTAAFATARHFRGGGFASDEVPAILHREEGVFTPQQMENADSLFAAALRPPIVNVTVVNNAGADVSVQESRDGNGQPNIEVVVDQAVSRRMNDGSSLISKALDRRGSNLPLREG